MIHDDGWIEWGGLPGRLRDAGVRSDRFGEFVLEAAECESCRKQVVMGIPVGAVVTCHGCGVELRRVK